MKIASRVRKSLIARLRALPPARHAHARLKRLRYELNIRRFVSEQSGRANQLPTGIVYEATMRCNLRCEFCYVGDLLNNEGEWRKELSLDDLRRAFPRQAGMQISFTGGEVFVRKDMLDVMNVFRDEKYTCGYLTTNGTLIDETRAAALIDLVSAGFLSHVSVSIDGPMELHDLARGAKGTFERTSAGLRCLQAAASRKAAPLRISINTTISRENLEALDRMVEVADELGVDAIGLNHLMFGTPQEVDDTLRLVGATDASVISTFVTSDPGIDGDRVRVKVESLERKCRERNIRFDFRPKVLPHLTDSYYKPDTPLGGRCLYPFLHARISFSGKVHFCPFIRVEVGDLTCSSLEEIWNNERYMELRRCLLENRLFPICRRCCKVELSPDRLPATVNAEVRLRHAVPATAVR